MSTRPELYKSILLYNKEIIPWTEEQLKLFKELEELSDNANEDIIDSFLRERNYRTFQYSVLTDIFKEPIDNGIFGYDVIGMICIACGPRLSPNKAVLIGSVLFNHHTGYRLKPGDFMKLFPDGFLSEKESLIYLKESNNKETT